MKGYATTIDAVGLQHAVYEHRYRIPVQISDGWVVMPVTGLHSAVTMPTLLAQRMMMRIPCASGIEDPLTGRTTLLVLPDVHINRYGYAMCDRAGVRIAKYGEQIRLPLRGDRLLRWIRDPQGPAYFARLHQIIDTLTEMGAAGRPAIARLGARR